MLLLNKPLFCTESHDSIAYLQAKQTKLCNKWKCRKKKRRLTEKKPTEHFTGILALFTETSNRLIFIYILFVFSCCSCWLLIFPLFLPLASKDRKSLFMSCCSLYELCQFHSLLVILSSIFCFFMQFTILTTLLQILNIGLANIRWRVEQAAQNQIIKICFHEYIVIKIMYKPLCECIKRSEA